LGIAVGIRADLVSQIRLGLGIVRSGICSVQYCWYNRGTKSV
jgi:hypothetical protein